MNEIVKRLQHELRNDFGFKSRSLVLQRVNNRGRIEQIGLGKKVWPDKSVWLTPVVATIWPELSEIAHSLEAIPEEAQHCGLFFPLGYMGGQKHITEYEFYSHTFDFMYAKLSADISEYAVPFWQATSNLDDVLLLASNPPRGIHGHKEFAPCALFADGRIVEALALARKYLSGFSGEGHQERRYRSFVHNLTQCIEK